MKLQESGVTGGYQRTRINGSNMLSGCPSSCAAGDLYVDTQHICVIMEHRAEIFKPEEAGTVSLHGAALPRPTGWGLKRCCSVITDFHALKLLSHQSWGVYTQLQSLCWTVEMCPEKGLWCLHAWPCPSAPMGAAVYLYWCMKAVLSSQPPLWDHLGQRAWIQQKWLLVPLPQWIITPHPPRDRWERNNPLDRS